MNEHVILLTIPGLRAADLPRMPRLQALTANGEQAPLIPSFPAVTWPVQANMLTGQSPRHHGVTANGFYWRDSREVEMWTAWNEKIECPQIWDLLHRHDPKLTSAVWFPMLSKGCGADYICMPAPIHNPDGSESLWCYTKPVELYGTLRDTFGHFPLMNFWGPMANVKSSAWIADSAAWAMREYRPNFFHIYLPHLDYAAQRTGPESEPALKAVEELDAVIGKLASQAAEAYGSANVLWLIAGEYAIVPVDHVTFPNRVLREAGLLQTRLEADGEHLDFESSSAWALVDHQFSHVYVKNTDPAVIDRVVDLFATHPGMAEVLAGEERAKYLMDHPRSGEVILISEPNSWQAYYWWCDDSQAPGFARTVDIHRKPGYDPVELHFDFATKSIPLNPALVKGSHGAPVASDAQRTVLLSSQKGAFATSPLPDTEIAEIVCRRFGL